MSAPRKCRCGTILNSYNTSDTCGPCEHTETQRRVAEIMAPPQVLKGAPDAGMKTRPIAESIGIRMNVAHRYLVKLEAESMVESDTIDERGISYALWRLAEPDYEAMMTGQDAA